MALLDIPPDRRTEGGDTMELKKCPFCGNTAKIVSFRVFTAMCYYVKCSCCDAEINRPVLSEKEAVED